jgi:hypothetical protein
LKILIYLIHYYYYYYYYYSTIIGVINIILLIKSRRMRWARNVARMGEKRGAHRILVARPEGRRPLGRPRRRWKATIKMDLQEVGWEAWTGLSWLMIGTGGGLL